MNPEMEIITDNLVALELKVASLEVKLANIESKLAGSPRATMLECLTKQSSEVKKEYSIQWVNNMFNKRHRRGDDETSVSVRG